MNLETEKTVLWQCCSFCRLTDSLTNGNDLEYNGEKLERYVYLCIEQTTALFNVHVPDVGSYHLEIFTTRTTTCDSSPGTKANGVDCLTTTTTVTTSTRTSPFRLKCSCKFQIVCPRLTSGRMLPLPECVAGEWGPAKAWRNFGMEALTHTNGIIYSDDDDDDLEIHFRCPSRFQIQCRLRSSHVTTDQALQGQAKVDRMADDRVAIRLRLDGAGQYGLDLYVRCDGQTLHHACKYLLNCKRRGGANSDAGPDGIPGPNTNLIGGPPFSKQQLAPSALGRVWGPTPAFQEFELHAISHPTPNIEMRKPGTLSVILGSDKPVKLSAILRRVSYNGGEVLSSRVTTKDYSGSKKTKFNVDIHRFDHGMFALEIDANAGSETINVYNYVIVKHPDQAAFEKRSSKGSFHL